MADLLTDGNAWLSVPAVAVLMSLLTSTLATGIAHKVRHTRRLLVVLAAIAAGCFLVGFCVNVVHLVASLI